MGIISNSATNQSAAWGKHCHIQLGYVTKWDSVLNGSYNGIKYCFREGFERVLKKDYVNVEVPLSGAWSEKVWKIWYHMKLAKVRYQVKTNKQRKHWRKRKQNKTHNIKLGTILWRKRSIVQCLINNGVRVRKKICEQHSVHSLIPQPRLPLRTEYSTFSQDATLL